MYFSDIGSVTLLYNSFPGFGWMRQPASFLPYTTPQFMIMVCSSVCQFNTASKSLESQGTKYKGIY